MFSAEVSEVTRAVPGVSRAHRCKSFHQAFNQVQAPSLTKVMLEMTWGLLCLVHQIRTRIVKTVKMPLEKTMI